MRAHRESAASTAQPDEQAGRDPLHKVMCRELLGRMGRKDRSLPDAAARFERALTTVGDGRDAKKYPRRGALSGTITVSGGLAVLGDASEAVTPRQALSPGAGPRQFTLDQGPGQALDEEALG